MPSKKPHVPRRKSAPVRSDAEADFVFQVGTWTILFHPLLLDQLERVVAGAERERRKERVTQGPNTKLAAALRHLMFKEVPEDPTRSKYRQGGTLGEDLKHWLRAKFGSGRFRLFFRYRTDARLLVFAWVNDEDSLRTYGSKTDAYTVFRRMLGEGNPPDDWDALVQAALSPEAKRRAQKLFRGDDQEG